MTNRVPARDNEGPHPTSRWFWLSVEEGDDVENYSECFLPSDLFNLLPNGIDHPETEDEFRIRYYESKKTAIDALNTATLLMSTNQQTDKRGFPLTATLPSLTPLNIRTVQNIGLLDRCLSVLKELALDPNLDEADTQTVKHHAEDCIGLGQRVLEILKEKK